MIPVRRGGNNRVFRLIGREKRAVLKIYPPLEDALDRLSREFAALSFLATAGVSEVPRPIARDRKRNWAVYEWIEGTPPGEISPTDVDGLADFFIGLQRLRQHPGALELAEGATPVLSPAGAVEQLGQRLARLNAVISPDSGVAQFVAAELTPEIKRAVNLLRCGCAAAGIDFDAPLAPSLRVLNPSDFGFHNTLRRPDGRLAFLDFEYFGWDGPSKAVADVMLHAGMSLSDELAQRYRARVTEALSQSDPDFPTRFAIFLPSIRAIWCLILLNEFLPERWARRVFAGAAVDRAAVEAHQLEKARELLARVLT